MANGVLYYNQCWVIAKKKSSRPEDQYNALSEIELMNFYWNLQCGADPVLDMNKIDLVYKKWKWHEKVSDLARDYKRKPKEVIEDYVPNAVFVKSKHENKPEQIITKDIQEEAVSTFIDDQSVEKTFKQCEKWQKNKTGFASTGLTLWRWYKGLSCTKNIIDLS